MDVKQIDTDLKSYSELTVNEGCIRLNPRTKRNIRAFVQWVKRLDEASNDDENSWQKAVAEEMTNNRVAFETCEGEIEKLIGHKEITAHLILDMQLSENFRREARCAADGHETKAPAAITHSSVVSRDLVRILLMTAALNDLDVCCADIQNAFLCAPNLEKVHMKAGPEFGIEQGKWFIVVRALCGLKSAAASFRAFMAEKLDNAGFKSSVADPDAWMRPAVKDNGDECHECTLMCVDDILSISVNAKENLMALETGTVKCKKGKVEEPTTCLGHKLTKKTIDDRTAWTASGVDYINAALKTLDKGLENRMWKIPSKATTPMTTSYSPELDGSRELENYDATLYQELIGILR